MDADLAAISMCIFAGGTLEIRGQQGGQSLPLRVGIQLLLVGHMRFADLASNFARNFGLASCHVVRANRSSNPPIINPLPHRADVGVPSLGLSGWTGAMGMGILGRQGLQLKGEKKAGMVQTDAGRGGRLNNFFLKFIQFYFITSLFFFL